MDRARLPHPQRHYENEVHALHHTGLGGSPPETVEGVSGCVGEAGLEEGRGEFPGGEGDPRPREEGEGIGGGSRELLQSPIPGRHRAVW